MDYIEADTTTLKPGDIVYVRYGLQFLKAEFRSNGSMGWVGVHFEGEAGISFIPDHRVYVQS